MNHAGLFKDKAGRGTTKVFLPRLLISHTVYTKYKFLFLTRYREETLFMPIDADDVFLSGEDAKNFFPIFLKKAVEEKLVNRDYLFDENREVNQDYCKMVVVPLKVSQLEVANDDEPD